MIRTLILFWEHAMYYTSLSYGEYGKIAQFFRDPLILVTALAVRGYKPRKWQIGMGVLIMILLSIFGGMLLLHLNIPQYNASLGNANNPQMVEILNNQKLILD